jgi:hypothetical protein
VLVGAKVDSLSQLFLPPSFLPASPTSSPRALIFPLPRVQRTVRSFAPPSTLVSRLQRHSLPQQPPHRAAAS